MQTFLPFRDFSLSAKALDSKRLNKQIVEAYQILTGRLSNKNHPACLMWEGNQKTLKEYILEFCKEYTKRFHKTHKVFIEISDNDYRDEKELFLNDSKHDINLFIFTHKINLLRKDYNFYKDKLSLNIPESKLSDYPEGYYWPVCKGITSKKHTENWIKFSQKS